ncbi:MAG TPA: hypothetical protein VFI31_15065, partial [Pirellulales bacterium]|nr:hypothetical protein [Pirellulales bacterium]
MECPQTKIGPQFSLKAIFAATTWAGAIAGLAVSHLAGWTTVAVGFSLAALNCTGRLAAWQTKRGQPRLFALGWMLLAASLLLPAVKGCNNESVKGWEAAMVCGSIAFDPPGSAEWPAVVWYDVLTFGNLPLVLSPLFLWRLRRGKGQLYGTLLAMSCAAMWSVAIRDADKVLVGYYVWCA